MSILIKKPTSGKLEKGRDHILECQLTWKDGTHPDLDSDVDAYYVSIKASDMLDDDDAIVALNSVDNPDQFQIIDADEGKLNFWLKKVDQEDIIPDTVKYSMDMVVILTDGTEFQYISDNNIEFSQPATRVTGHTI
jgi:hypothetical protein